MHKSLRDTVSDALGAADREIKLASASDALLGGAGEVDFLKLAADEGDDEADEKDKGKKESAPPFAKKDDKDKAKDKDGEKRAAIAYATKVAQALDVAIPLVTHLVEVEKTAAATRSPLNAPGPKVVASPQMSGGGVPKPGPTAAKPLPRKVGPQGQLPTNKGDYGSPDWTKNKEAAAAFISVKEKQASLLEDLGQTESAELVRREVAEARAKIAEDPSSPGAAVSNTGNGGRVLTIDPPVPGGRVPDNKGMASITKGQAVDPTVREAGNRIQQKPKVDPTVAATQLTAAGTKISSVLAKYTPRQEIVR